MGNLNDKKKITPKTVNPIEFKNHVALVEIKIGQQRHKKIRDISNKRKEIAKSLNNNQLDIAKLKMSNIMNEENFIVALDILLTVIEQLKEKVTYLLQVDKCPEEMRAVVDTVIYASYRVDIVELQKIREAMGIKYGSLFISNANNNVDKIVNVPIIEKLSNKNFSSIEIMTRLKQVVIEDKIEYFFPPEDSKDGVDFFPKTGGSGGGQGDSFTNPSNLYGNIGLTPMQPSYNVNQEGQNMNFNPYMQGTQQGFIQQSQGYNPMYQSQGNSNPLIQSQGGFNQPQPQDNYNYNNFNPSNVNPQNNDNLGFPSSSQFNPQINQSQSQNQNQNQQYGNFNQSQFPGNNNYGNFQQSNIGGGNDQGVGQSYGQFGKFGQSQVYNNNMNQSQFNQGGYVPQNNQISINNQSSHNPYGQFNQSQVQNQGTNFQNPSTYIPQGQSSENNYQNPSTYVPQNENINYQNPSNYAPDVNNQSNNYNLFNNNDNSHVDYDNKLAQSQIKNNSELVNNNNINSNFNNPSSYPSNLQASQNFFGQNTNYQDFKNNYGGNNPYSDINPSIKKDLNPSVYADDTAKDYNQYNQFNYPQQQNQSIKQSQNFGAEGNIGSSINFEIGVNNNVADPNDQKKDDLP